MSVTENRPGAGSDEGREQTHERAHHAPELPREEAPARYEQDTQPVDGEVATHLPPEEELGERQPIQG